MARSYPISTLVSRAQLWSDKRTDGSISTTEWKTLLGMAYAEAYSTVVEAGCRVEEAEATLTITGATSYAEPATILHLIGVDFIDSSSRRRPLVELMVQERGAFTGQTGEARYFTHADGVIALYPVPSGGTYKVLYVPQAPDLSAYADATSVDVWCGAGERYVVWGAVSIAQHVSETHQQRAMAERDRALADLQYWAANRALNQPRRRMVDMPAGPDAVDPDFWSNLP